MMPARVDAILPAGGRISGRFAAEAGAAVKALIPLCDGRAVIERTLHTLRATGRIGRVVVIGPAEVAGHPAAREADVVLPEGGSSGVANIMRGLQWLEEANADTRPDRVLVLTTDLPFFTPEAVTGFLDACPSDLDICLPIIERKEFHARFPGLPVRFARLRDGHWVIGCAFLVNPTALGRNRRLIERAFASRKSQILMAGLLGPLFIFRFLAGRLTVGMVEEQCLRLLGCTGKGIRGCPPELAFDIDRRKDLHYVRTHCPDWERKNRHETGTP